MVRALPDLPTASRGPRRRAARTHGSGRAAAVHAGWPVRDGRRLPRGPAGSRATHPPARRRGPARDRAVADPHGRVPRLGRDVGPQPGARLGAGHGARWRDAGRLPARHVRARSADAADPAPSRHRPGRRVARRPRGRRPQHLRLGVARRLRRRGRVPRRRLRQRCPPLRRPGPAEGEARRARRRERAVLWAALDPRDVRHRPRGPLPSPGGSRRRDQRRRFARRRPAGDARGVRGADGHRAIRWSGGALDAASSAPGPARTC